MAKNKKKPLVSVIVVNYNASAWLTKCLVSIARNTYSNYEVIVVDNSEAAKPASPIPQPPRLNLQKPRRLFLGEAEELTVSASATPKVMKLTRNFGPAYARNRGAEKASGQYLAFLDNDTEVHKDWLTQAVAIFERDATVGALQCKLLLNKNRDRFDYAGDYMTQWGFLAQAIEADTKDTNQVLEGLEILAAKSAGMLIRADTFKKIGGFDEDYFIYLEETDLSWRVWLSGKRVVFTNQSIVYHEFGTTTMLHPKLGQRNAKYHGTKNYISTLIKNLGTKNLLKILPLHLCLWFDMSLFLFLKGNFKGSFYVLSGIFYSLRHLPKLLKERRIVQTSRQVTDNQTFPKIFKRVSLSYFLHKLLGRSEPIGFAKGW